MIQMATPGSRASNAEGRQYRRYSSTMVGMLSQTSGLSQPNIPMNIFSTKWRLFFFEEYFMTTKENYKVQEQYGVPAYEADKVKIFLEGIKIQTSQSKWQ